MPSGLAGSPADVITKHVVTAIVLNCLPKALDQVISSEERFAPGIFCKQLERAARVVRFPFRLIVGIELGITNIIRMSESTLLSRGRTRCRGAEIDRIDGNLSVVHHSPEIVIGRMHLVPMMDRTSRIAHQLGWRTQRKRETGTGPDKRLAPGQSAKCLGNLLQCRDGNKSCVLGLSRR